MQLSAISLAITRPQRSGTAAWSPASLFASSEEGAWYDPSDLTTMFQDRAGTTPVTADGQTVGLILDKSGRGNHNTAPSDAARPLYRTDGTYHWLQFDGVDDSLNTATINFTATDKISLAYGIKRANDSAAIIAELSLNNIANDGTFYNLSGTDSGYTGYSGVSRGSAPTAGGQACGINSTAAIPAVVTLTHNISGDLSTIRLNTNDGTSGTGDQGSGSFGDYPIYVGRRGAGGLFLNGSIYSLIIRGALSTAGEITDTETWVNGKTGAY